MISAQRTVRQITRNVTLPGFAAIIAVGSASCLHAQAAQPTPDPALATQPSPPPASGLGDIVVTATRRAENLQRVPISVTALSATELRSLGVKQSTDIVAQIPGLKYNAFSPTLTVFNIRGVSQNNSADQLEAPVAVYIDDAYVAVMGAAGVPSFDMQRVEVLRGPQGTLFGRNATGGLINFISAAPTKDFEGFIDANGGSRANFHVNGAVSGPIADNVQARLSAIYNHADGYVKNSLGPNGGNQNNFAVRAQLAFQPTDTLNIRLIGRYAENRHEHTTATSALAGVDADGRGVFLPSNSNPYGTCDGCDLLGYHFPSSPFRVDSDEYPIFNRKVYGGQARVELNLGPGTVTSITDYLKMSKFYQEDSDGTPNPILIYDTDTHYHQFSQELKYAMSKGPFRYTFGGYYLNTVTTLASSIDSKTAIPFGASEDDPFFSGFLGHYVLNSWSAYAQGELDIAPRLTATLGGRYVNEIRTTVFDQSETGFPDVVFSKKTAGDLAREHYKDYALRAALNYRLNPETLFYASFNRGIKGPNFDTPGFQPFDLVELPYKGETLLDYEAGIKTSFFDNKLRLDLSGYVYDYSNYQAYFISNFRQKTVNVPATAHGLELEVTALPTRELMIAGGLALEKSKVRDVGLPSGRLVNTELPQAPRVSGNLLVHYEKPISDELKVNGQFDMTFTGKSYFTVAQEPVNLEHAYAVGNIQFNLAAHDDKWTAGVFVRNLWDQHYRVYAGDASFIGGSYNIFAEPREFGVQTHYNF